MESDRARTTVWAGNAAYLMSQLKESGIEGGVSARGAGEPAEIKSELPGLCRVVRTSEPSGDPVSVAVHEHGWLAVAKGEDCGCHVVADAWEGQKPLSRFRYCSTKLVDDSLCDADQCVYPLAWFVGIAELESLSPPLEEARRCGCQCLKLVILPLNLARPAEPEARFADEHLPGR